MGRRRGRRDNRYPEAEMRNITLSANNEALQKKINELEKQKSELDREKAILKKVNYQNSKIYKGLFSF